MPEVLLVAATEPELCGHPGLVCGVGPVEAAAATAARLAVGDVDAVLHIGIAGARREAGFAVGELVVGADSFYEDLVTVRRFAPEVVVADAVLVAAASQALGVEAVRIGTTGRVGGADSCLVEAMEGFAVLRAAELAGVPAVEVRAISNLVEDERADWRMDDALAALAQALPGLVAVITAAVSPSP